MFTFSNLVFSYRERLFEGYSDSISEPRIGIVGINGSGKTTLLRLIDGQLLPQAGYVETHGSTYLVDFNLRRYRSFTVEDLISLCRPLRSFDVSRSDRLASMLHMDEYRRIPIGELSKGMTKKVSLLLGLMSTADVLLIDEPFESIDAESNANLLQLLNEERRGLVIVSHDLTLLEQAVDAVYSVQNRRLERRCLAS
ncbi:MAG: ATP-binding cassette domain-containing protein [Micropruina sp.]|nr:ATP-binding cassette domain-containing protein [Micropruina sp.]